MQAQALTFALPKGRILGPATKLLRAAGFDLGEVGIAKDRRLMFDLPGGGRALLVKPSDVPTYVEHGVADVGISGADTLREQAHDLYEPVDLGIGACRLAVPCSGAHTEPSKRAIVGLKVARHAFHFRR